MRWSIPPMWARTCRWTNGFRPRATPAFARTRVSDKTGAGPPQADSFTPEAPELPRLLPETHPTKGEAVVSLPRSPGGGHGGRRGRRQVSYSELTTCPDTGPLQYFNFTPEAAVHSAIPNDPDASYALSPPQPRPPSPAAPGRRISYNAWACDPHPCCSFVSACGPACSGIIRGKWPGPRLLWRQDA
jgi:hypothetical protein